ncbi:hypothetical protein EO244_16270 [Ancylomarina salipaludis]|uniref:Uncharacterized protein n=1 Tax=Ancylomarina salipaludis TaxID=2501299 RepID=A0A4Q1JHV4_9BACT|nr:hypothetical protein [Ancylomarina salipaludis]RXQ87626.1 hypothetical protein EO244_16270 [Ancylomarina salipaludis]
MKREIRIPILLVLFCFLTMPFKSCVDSDDYDFDRLSDKVDWQPNFVAPIGYGEYSLWYLLNQHEELEADQTIILGDDGLIHIKHIEKDIFSYGTDEVLTFPTQDPYSTTFDMSDYPTVSIPFPSDQTLASTTKGFNIKADGTDIILTKLKLDTKVSFTVSNPVDKAIKLTVTLDEGSVGGVNPLSKDFDIIPNANGQTFDWDLTDLEFTFPSPSINNTLHISFGVTILADASGTIRSNGNDLEIGYQFGGLAFKLAKGDFGDQTIDVGSGTIDMGVDFWDDIDGNFTFADPRISLMFNNTVGVPFLVSANMTGSNTDGETLSLDPDDQLPAYPTTEADVLAGIEASITYNKDNSQIVPFMALPPSGDITYSGSVRINRNLDGTRYDPLAAGNNINIISGTSSITADLEMDIPMDFKADNLSISDTIDEVDISDAEKIVKAALIITSENGLPLDVKIENIFLTDASYTVLSTISNESIINAAGVTANGEVDPSTVKEVVNTIELSEDQIKSLNDTENIIIKAAVSTYDEGKQSVKLKGSDKLKFSISVNAQVDLSK